MTTVSALVPILKEAGEDFEFYPTTDEIIGRLKRDIRNHVNTRDCSHFTSFLDIGAGHGKVLKAIREWEGTDKPELYAIEKSLILCRELASVAFIIGTEFEGQSLLDKSIQVTFCNPPYSVFGAWAEKIIRESASTWVYLVLPTRWQEDARIAAALAYRDTKAYILGEFTFEKAEDRRARCTVNLIRVELQYGRSREGDEHISNAFSLFFNETFKDLRIKFAQSMIDEKGTDKKDKRFEDLVSGRNIAQTLVAFYHEDLEKISKNYRLVADLDVDLMREFNITPDTIKTCLHARRRGLRLKYWSELFRNMHEITDRLTSAKRRLLLDVLNANGHVDFTEANAYAVILWVLEHAQKYIEEQLKDTFFRLAELANIRNYKSNQKVFEKYEWRYAETKPTHVCLDFRLVLQRCGGLKRCDFKWDQGLEERAAELIQDILTVAYNLGFRCNTTDYQVLNRRAWKDNGARIFDYIDGDNRLPLLEVRAFFNGNMHIRMSQKLALAMNVEMGRLSGWLQNKAQAVDELRTVDAQESFGTCFSFVESKCPLLPENIA